MKLINLYGGPGTGKSTTAARLFAELKGRGLNVELVTEFAKDLTWHNRQSTLQDQLYILGKQHHKIFMLKDQVDFIVTDSPILMGIYYNSITTNPLPISFTNLISDLWDQYDSVDIFLRRSKKYNPKGRNQTEKEAKLIDGALIKLMTDYGIPFWTYDTCNVSIQAMINDTIL